MSVNGDEEGSSHTSVGLHGSIKSSFYVRNILEVRDQTFRIKVREGGFPTLQEILSNPDFMVYLIIAIVGLTLFVLTLIAYCCCCYHKWCCCKRKTLSPKAPWAPTDANTNIQAFVDHNGPKNGNTVFNSEDSFGFEAIEMSARPEKDIGKIGIEAVSDTEIMRSSNLPFKVAPMPELENVSDS